MDVTRVDRGARIRLAKLRFVKAERIQRLAEERGLEALLVSIFLD